LARLEAGATPEELLAAQADIDSTAAALQLAQSEYDKIAWQSGLGATGQAMNLRQASNDYERAKANYQALVKGATAEELDIARAAIEAARTQVEVAQAQAGQAKAQLDLLLVEPAAEARVQQAQTALQGAKTALEKTVLVAPLSGTVGDVMVEEGETVMAGAPVLVIGDLSALQVETDDLSEVDIVEVAVGQEVEVSVDAMPDLELGGWVSEISPMAEEQHGDIVYTVTIDLEERAAASLR
jgi:multidrug resistance efflux pump